MIKSIKKQAGFTLVELMIVIAIIGILAAIAIPNFLSYQQKGYDSAAQSEAQNYFSTAMAYFGEKGTSAAITLTKTDMPKGFRHDATSVLIDGTGITQATDGALSGDLTFQHKKSSTIYKIDALNGRVVKQ